LESRDALGALPKGKLLINTINAHSYNTALKDEAFAEALTKGDVLIPDGASIVMACKFLKAKSRPKERIAGWDLFVHEMGKLNVESLGLSVEGDSSRAQNVESLGLRVERDSSQAQNDKADDDGHVDGLGMSVKGDSLQAQNDRADGNYGGNVDGLELSVEGDSSQAQNIESLGFRGERRKKKVMFMGSSEKVLALIKERAAVDYPNIEVVTYSPPYKPEFTDEENAEMVRAINEAKPDLLWIGMTAPKQEKWTYKHWGELDIDCHVGTIGAVFDFYAGTMKRAPLWWQEHSLEWLFRLLKEPKRMWRRYLVGNALFLWNVIKLKVKCLVFRV
jgi:exopolysaccharide biosynthesis WecB/TagA/CpsF family protein